MKRIAETSARLIARIAAAFYVMVFVTGIFSLLVRTAGLPVWGTRCRTTARRRVPDSEYVEDIVQEVFYELVEANRLLMPIDHMTRWLSASRS